MSATSCTTNADCLPSHFCEKGSASTQCTQDCNSDSDCPPGDGCLNNRLSITGKGCYGLQCLPCLSNSDCSSQGSPECVTLTTGGTSCCKRYLSTGAAYCTTSADCPPNHFCEKGSASTQCTQECKSDSDCQPGDGCLRNPLSISGRGCYGLKCSLCQSNSDCNSQDFPECVNLTTGATSCCKRYLSTGAASCTANADCPPSHFCEKGSASTQCTQECKSDSDCRPGDGCLYNPLSVTRRGCYGLKCHSAQQQASPSPPSPPIGLIAGVTGGVVGGVALMGGIAVCVFLAVRRKKRGDTQKKLPGGQGEVSLASWAPIPVVEPLPSSGDIKISWSPAEVSESVSSDIKVVHHAVLARLIKTVDSPSTSRSD